MYSSSEKETRNLRDLSTDNGLLKEGQSLEIGQMPLLPYNVFSDLDSSKFEGESFWKVVAFYHNLISKTVKRLTR